jgi:hypothetical protein
MEAEVYKLTVPRPGGQPLVAYVLPRLWRHAARSMQEEYGQVEVTPMAMADLPEGVSFPADTEQ